MVSFFGLKLGSDRKKSQTKAQIKAQPETTQNWNRDDRNVTDEGQKFAQNFSRPRFPSAARPDTANSMRDNSNWRTVFKNRSMTASLVDLASPRRRQPSVGSLRCAASDMNLRSSTAHPATLSGGANRQGLPNRPATSHKAEWVNPLGVHYPQDPGISHLRTGHTPNDSALAASPIPRANTDLAAPRRLPANRSLSSSDWRDVSRDTNHTSVDRAHQSDDDHVIRNGYPSPPQSEDNSERAFSPAHCAISDNVVSVNKRNPSSSLRKMEVPGEKDLLEPHSSLHQTRQERNDAPIIRTVPARRDTIAFHSPRGRSLTMEFECTQRSTMMHPPIEGFSGNFADFDFGESVTKITSSAAAQVVVESGLEKTTRQASVSSKRSGEYSPKSTAHDAPGPELVYATKEYEREQSKSPAPTQESEDQVANSSLIDQLPEPPRQAIRRPSTSSSGATSIHQKVSHGLRISPRHGFQSSRFNSETSSRAPPPRPLQRVASAIEVNGKPELRAESSHGSSPLDSSSSRVKEDKPTSRRWDRLPLSPFSRRTIEGDSTVSQSLPRGRLPESLQSPTGCSFNDEDGERLLPAWSDLGRSSPRRSAIPAPLTPSPARTTHSASPGAPTSPLAIAPRLPSPTFPSLAEFISTSDGTFGTSFNFDFDEHLNSPALGGSNLMARQPSTSAVGNARRAEAKHGSLGPAPETLPSSPDKDDDGTEYTSFLLE
ncbi:hypothetical protein E4U57_000211 [Claviceps arundinis]|uniref:Uncharacterized protein n=1 Tax=Claviceps arundinis TaxID=1623583 RepID=A0A9P7MQC9_9HYPO|nr:hypothetical protein E4U57_000211 [Claviceps arundinis]KAG5963428.1 hypothetical protein E4U56_002753 [Claviceps arundinis]